MGKLYMTILAQCRECIKYWLVGRREVAKNTSWANLSYKWLNQNEFRFNRTDITLPCTGIKVTHPHQFYNCIHCMIWISALFSTFTLVWPVQDGKKQRHLFHTNSELLKGTPQTAACNEQVNAYPLLKMIALTKPYEMNLSTCLGADLQYVAMDTNLQSHCSHPRWVYSRSGESPP